MKKIIGAIVVGVLAISIFVGCTDKEKSTTDKGKIKIMASIYPMAELAREIGGDKVSVNLFVTKGTDAHHFEPKPKEYQALLDSEIFVYNGLGMEHWVDSVLKSVDKNKVTIVDASKGINTLDINGKVDPHVWLSLKNAEIQAKNIEIALIEKDPNNKSYYENNYKIFSQKCNDLINEYKGKFESLKQKNFVTGHAAFGYLCNEFGLKQKAITDMYSDGEPVPGKLKELVEFCKENNVKSIFAGSSEEDKSAQTIAKEVGGKVYNIYTLESQTNNETYIEGMKYNLETIYKGLNE